MGPDSNVQSRVRVLFSCTGVGVFNRGIESFFREAFDGLKAAPELEARLLKGAEDSGEPRTRNAEHHERTVWCLPRTRLLASWIGKLTRRSAYAVEQWSSFPGVVHHIRQFRPDVLFTSEANLIFLLRRFRRQIGVPFRILYSNGGPVHPPFTRYDFVHQVAPLYYEEAIQAGEPKEKHFHVPYGIRPPKEDFLFGSKRNSIRSDLGLPLDRKVVLSVGWIAKQHKRTDYVIREIASMPHPRPFLVMLGAMDDDSAEVVDLARELLGEGEFIARSVEYSKVADYYRAADVFVLGSLAEGFGRVYLEALAHGLPTIGHDHPVIRYVLGSTGIVADLSKEGSLASNLSLVLQKEPSPQDAYRRRQDVLNRFSWERLQSEYLWMFRSVRASARLV